MLHCDPQAAFSVSLKCTPHIEKQDIDSALYDRPKKSRYSNNVLAISLSHLLPPRCLTATHSHRPVDYSSTDDVSSLLTIHRRDRYFSLSLSLYIYIYIYIAFGEAVSLTLLPKTVSSGVNVLNSVLIVLFDEYQSYMLSSDLV